MYDILYVAWLHVEMYRYTKKFAVNSQELTCYTDNGMSHRNCLWKMKTCIYSAQNMLKIIKQNRHSSLGMYVLWKLTNYMAVKFHNNSGKCVQYDRQDVNQMKRLLLIRTHDQLLFIYMFYCNCLSQPLEGALFSHIAKHPGNSLGRGFW